MTHFALICKIILNFLKMQLSNKDLEMLFGVYLLSVYETLGWNEKILLRQEDN